jgi:hypothetical protein
MGEGDYYYGEYVSEAPAVRYRCDRGHEWEERSTFGRPSHVITVAVDGGDRLTVCARCFMALFKTHCGTVEFVPTPTADEPVTVRAKK